MALKKIIQYKGFAPEYWSIIKRIWDKITGRTIVVLACFKDEATSKIEENGVRTGLLNDVSDLRQEFSFEGDIDTATSYDYIKRVVNTDGSDGFFKDAVDA